MVFFGVLNFIFLVCSFRTNLVLVWILFTVVLGVGLLVGAYFQTAMQDAGLAHKLQVVRPSSTLLMNSLSLVINTRDHHSRAEGLFCSPPVSVDGIYYFLCCSLR